MHDHRSYLIFHAGPPQWSLPTALVISALLLAALPALARNSSMGQYTANPYAADRLSSQGGVIDNPYASGSTSPKLYDGVGNFRGTLNANKYDPDSISNPYGRYGSQLRATV